MSYWFPDEICEHLLWNPDVLGNILDSHRNRQTYVKDGKTKVLMVKARYKLGFFFRNKVMEISWEII